MTSAGPCAPPGTAAPGSLTGLAAGRGIGNGILDPLVLIFAVSVLLTGLLAELIAAIRVHTSFCGKEGGTMPSRCDASAKAKAIRFVREHAGDDPTQ